MAKKGVEKPYNNGEWTAARMQSFVVGALRKATQRWGPRNHCLKEASLKAKGLVMSDVVKYKQYLTKKGAFKTGPFICEICNTIQMATIPVPKGSKSKKKKLKNKISDHIDPIVDPTKGFSTYDEWVRRGFPEKEAFQAVCHGCHQVKCSEERDIATERKRAEKRKSSLQKK